MADEPSSTATPAESGDAGQAPVQPGADAPVLTGEQPAAASEPPKTEGKEKPDPVQRKIAGLSYQNRELRRQVQRMSSLVEQGLSGRRAESPVPPPKMSDFGTVEEYLDARDSWRDQQREQTRKPEGEAKPQRPAVDQEYESTVAEARENLFAAGSEKYEDFAEVIEAGQGITPVMRDAIFAFDDDTQVEMAYYLAKNPKDALRIARLAPVRQIAEIGKLEAKLTSPPPPKRVSAAPAPVAPVGGASTASDTIRPGMDFKDFLKVRNKQLGRK